MGGQSATPDSEKIAKKREKSGKKRKNWEEKNKNREGSFTLPLLTDKAGYTTGFKEKPSKRPIKQLQGLYTQANVFKIHMPVTFAVK